MISSTEPLPPLIGRQADMKRIPIPGFRCRRRGGRLFTHATAPCELERLVAGGGEGEKQAWVPMLEGLHRPHEDPHLADVGDRREEEGVVRYAVDRPAHLDSIVLAPIGSAVLRRAVRRAPVGSVVAHADRHPDRLDLAPRPSRLQARGAVTETRSGPPLIRLSLSLGPLRQPSKKSLSPTKSPKKTG